MILSFWNLVFFFLLTQEICTQCWQQNRKITHKLLWNDNKNEVIRETMIRRCDFVTFFRHRVCLFPAFDLTISEQSKSSGCEDSSWCPKLLPTATMDGENGSMQPNYNNNTTFAPFRTVQLYVSKPNNISKSYAYHG